MSLTPAQTATITFAIDASFNAMLAEAFLCGLYTLLFGYTLQMLLRKANKKVYAAVLTCLWVVVMLAFAFDWQYHRTAFVVDNDSPLDIAKEATGGNGIHTVNIFDNVLSMCCNLFADALMVWRCYILWEDKRWVLFPLPILLIAAAVLGSMASAQHFHLNDNFHLILLVAFFFVSIAITFMGTSLIILRILLVTRNSPLTAHTSTYRKIQRVLIESGIVYTIAMFIAGVSLAIVVGSNEPLNLPLNDLATYTEAILIPLSGIAPTLTAIRVGYEATVQADTSVTHNRPESRVLSRLTFRRTARQNDTSDVEDSLSYQYKSPTDSNMDRRGDKEHVQELGIHN